MTITLLQTDIRWSDPQANMQNVEALITSAPPSDLYVLPEMWNTGFLTQPQDIAAEENGESLLWMQRMAQQFNAAIAGSIATHCTDGTFRNRFYFVTPSNTYHYDKHHLFTYAGEHEQYTAGQERVIVEWCGVRFLLQVCYDLRFPCFSRNHDDYDCILYVASWPTSRINVWDTLLQARAIENQCYVAGINRIGADPNCDYPGHTMLVDARGHIVARCDDNTQQAITHTLDLDALHAFRTKFPVLRDRDRSEPDK